MLSFSIRLSVIIKEYKRSPLAQRKVALTPWKYTKFVFLTVAGTQINLLSSWEQWCFSRSKYKGAFRFHWTNWCEGLHKAVILHLIGSSTTRKSFNEYGFFVAVTSLNKIGEGRIWDFTSDVLFPVTFKCAMLIVIRKDPRPYWCIMSNTILMCIENRADLPRPWTEVLTP